LGGVGNFKENSCTAKPRARRTMEKSSSAFYHLGFVFALLKKYILKQFPTKRDRTHRKGEKEKH